MRSATLLSCALCAGLSSSAFAGYNITQGADGTNPTYSTVINFDGEADGALATNTYAGVGLASLAAGGGDLFIGDNTASLIGSGKSALAPFGVFMNFGTDVDALSIQIWDPSGAPSPFGGGLLVVAFNDGVEVAGGFGNAGGAIGSYEPAFGGVGNTDFNITADSGMVFDEVRILGLGFDPSTYADNISFNAVPEPASVSMLALAGLATLRRRR